MIKYPSGSYGFSILFRVHGSAVYKSLTPSVLSSLVYVLLYFTTDIHTDPNSLFRHPYPIGALIAALTFLLAFRANFSYNRYWEAQTAVHHMHSKWLDVGMELAAYHLQSSVYDKRKPPSFGEYPEIYSLERARERLNQPTLAELETQLDEMVEQEPSIIEESSSNMPLRSHFRRRHARNRKQHSTIESKDSLRKAQKCTADRFVAPPKSINAVSQPLPEPSYNLSPFSQLARLFQQKPALSEKKQNSVGHVVQSFPGHKMNAWENGKPPLFLQEAAHLLSLLSAVAFSTLRNDLEQAGSPLIPFTPGAPWPHVDPDAYTADVRRDWANTQHRSVTVLKYICGVSRTPKARTLYNAARPFRVVAGVSDSEIELLQAARGPSAKVSLVSLWLLEFISREYLAGSTGNVSPPVISRLYQCISDGMNGYNQARKIAYIPFPFPHAQITSLFVLVVVGLMPLLMLQYVSNETFGFILNLLTVMCFTGLHEVARELENPFMNVPNDVPLNNFQAQFNESLLQMFTGYHPDAYWKVVVNENKEENESAGDRILITQILDPPRESDEDEERSGGELIEKEVQAFSDSPV